ncbi:BED-type domain-containing protein [Abeliophyllum distichum]|uniref:BED-type domain-containing protein n=1 Tax=Abeliophyllum distichum TaxID=126358 RepID=A0ABD1RDA9_9LAMI
MSKQEHCSIGSTHGTLLESCNRSMPTTNASNPPSLSAGENSRQIPISIDSDGDHTTDLGIVSRKRKLTSEVWNHFMLKNIDNEIKAICNYCGAELVGHSKNGTIHLKKHLDRCALRKCKQTDIRQELLNPTKQVGGKVVMGT